MLTHLRKRLSYANVIATTALFMALGGTSYAVFHVDSNDVVNNSLRSRDIKNNTIRSRDVRDRMLRASDIGRSTLGSRVIKESSLGRVPRAVEADRLGDAASEALRVRCPQGTSARAGVCIERTARSPDGFFGAINRCDSAGRGLATMPQLDRMASTSGPLPSAEWTSSVYRNPDNGPMPRDQLEAVILGGPEDISYERVFLAVQHPFRCVALPSN